MKNLHKQPVTLSRKMRWEIFLEQIDSYRSLWSSKHAFYLGLLVLALAFTQCKKQETITNQAPVFGAIPALRVPENSKIGTEVGTISATDPDPNAIIAYSLSGESVPFSIDPNNGNITVKEATLDYETNPSYTFSVEANDGTATTGLEVSVSVTDIDETPSFAELPALNVTEDATPGTAVGTISATDPDGESVSYSLTQQDGSTSTEFAINSSSGAISVKTGATLDYETATSYNIKLTASDATQNATQNATITVTDVDEAPAFAPIDAANDISSPPQNVEIGYVVATMNAADPEGGTVSYSITAPASHPFAIGSSTGIITVASAIPATPTSYTLTIEASATQNSNQSATRSLQSSSSGTQMITIDVGAATVLAFVQAPYTFEVPENSAVDTSVTGTPAISVTGHNGTITYSLTIDGINASPEFKIDATSGAISVKAATLDHEDAPSYSLKVHASDQSQPSQTETADVTINITNIDETPVFKGTPYNTFRVRENATAGTVVGTILAEDPEDDAIIYSFDPPSTDFGVDNNGEITVSSDLSLDDTVTPTISLTAKATDGNSNSVTEPVSITIIDQNVLAFTHSSYTFSIDENSAPDTPVTGTPIGASGGTDPITYELYESDGTSTSDEFQIDSNTGIISISSTTSENFNYEDYASGAAFYSLKVKAISGTQSETVDVTITVEDIDEPPTFDAATYAFDVPEDAAAGTTVGTISATDPEGAALSYKFVVDGSPVAATAEFTIDNAGLISIKAGTMLDYESGTQRYALTVRITDGTNSIGKSVTIAVTNVDEPPAFDEATYAFSIAEDATAGTVGTISATDPEGATTPTYGFVVGGNPATETTEFTIDNAGLISIKAGATFDYETTSSYFLTVRATDGTYSIDKEITIAITDVDEPPTFDEDSYTFQVVDGTVGDGETVLGTVSATDPEDPTLTIDYQIISPWRSSFWMGENGEIMLKPGQGVNISKKSTHTLLIEAADRTEDYDGTQSDHVEVTIEVVPPPILISFEKATYSFCKGSLLDSVKVVVSQAPGTGESYTIPISVAASSTAVAPTDYALPTDAGGTTVTEVSIMGTDTHAIYEITLVDDGIADGAQTIVLEIGDLGTQNLELGEHSSTTITLNDPVPGGMIPINYLEQLDAMRYDLDGDGLVDVKGYDVHNADGGSTAAFNSLSRAEAQALYDAQFHCVKPNTALSSPRTYTGYRLMRSLNFSDPNSYAGDEALWYNTGTIEDPAGNSWTHIGQYSEPVEWTAPDPVPGETPPTPPATIPSYILATTFDGGGYTLDSLYINYCEGACGPGHTGLFSYVGTGGTIRDLGLVSPFVKGGGEYLGGLVGKNKGGTISNCYVSGGAVGSPNAFGEHTVIIYFPDDRNRPPEEGPTYTVPTVLNSFVGGLVGENENGTISNCYVSGGTIIKGNSFVGGLVGKNKEGTGTVSSCYVSGAAITGSEYMIGGLIGENENNTISSCYVLSTEVNSKSHAGGLIGSQRQGGISACYVKGSTVTTEGVPADAHPEHIDLGVLIAPSATGGLVGDMFQGTLYGCYVQGATVDGGVGSPYVGGLAGHIDATTVYACYVLNVPLAGTDGVGSSDPAFLGGVIGVAQTTSSINACYAGGSNFEGALGGRHTNSTFTNGYYQAGTGGRSATGFGTSKTFHQLRSPTTFGASASDMYHGWDIGTDGNTGAATTNQIWDLGSATQFPRLKLLDFNGDGVANNMDLDLQDFTYITPKVEFGTVTYQAGNVTVPLIVIDATPGDTFVVPIITTGTAGIVVNSSSTAVSGTDYDALPARQILLEGTRSLTITLPSTARAGRTIILELGATLSEAVGLVPKPGGTTTVTITVP